MTTPLIILVTALLTAMAQAFVVRTLNRWDGEDGSITAALGDWARFWWGSDWNQRGMHE